MITAKPALTCLRIVLALVVGGYSLALAIGQLHGGSHRVLLFLGIAEFTAACLFLVPPTIRLGGVALLVVFAAGAVFHVLHGEYSIGYLAVYAAAVYAVLSRGRQA